MNTNERLESLSTSNALNVSVNAHLCIMHANYKNKPKRLRSRESRYSR